MAFKFVIFFAALAYANAGLLPAAAPVAYSPAAAVSHAYISQPAVAVAHAAPVAVAHAAPVAVHAPTVGASQQNVYRSYGGNQAISTYSKAEDSAFSSVRKYDTRITNDALSVYAHAAPVAATYAAPVAASYAAPAYSTYAHSGPAYSYAHAAPAYTSYAHAAPLAAAPVVAKAAVPVAYSPAVAVSHMTFSGLGVNYGW
ncbi:hypothetical protein HHI36_015860 [Cryptolaemus montrouzieri]|uniref:Uncharacterized protein n=1 Tax=Cryptolaemus montrouzieri TaxID=559131 RepID=A0ABD2N6X8_9CUCU